MYVKVEEKDRKLKSLNRLLPVNSANTNNNQTRNAAIQVGLLVHFYFFFTEKFYVFKLKNIHCSLLFRKLRFGNDVKMGTL